MSCADHSISGETFEIIECTQCGLWITSPRPDNEQLGAYYHSSTYISHSDTSEGIINKLYKIVRNYTLRQKLKLVRQYVQKGSILDVGCGAGYFLDACRNAGFDVSGIEPDNSTRNTATEKFKLDIFSEDMLDHFEADFFDLISMWHVLEHVPDPDKRLHQLHRILKPGGMLFIAVPNRSSYDARHYGAYWAGYDVPRHLWHFSPHEITTIAEKSGFTMARIRPMYFDAFYVSILSEKYKRNAFSLLKGFWIGFVSNMLAMASSRNQYSSQIFILKKQY